MAQRHNEYDAAFEECLRHTRTPYVVVDERRRALLREASLKSMDFIVYSRQHQNLLVDVKGRKFPSGGEAGSHKWENWATQEDIDCLLKWEQVFGDGFRAVLVFAYDIVDPRFLREFDTVFRYRGHIYAFYGVWVDEYQQAMRLRSASWETVSLPSKEFEKLRAPILQLL